MNGPLRGIERLNDARLKGIKRVVAGYLNAPAGIEDYTWMSVPRYWESVRVPGAGSMMIEPRHEDRHGGVSFRVGWNVSERVVAIWIL